MRWGRLGLKARELDDDAMTKRWLWLNRAKPHSRNRGRLCTLAPRFMRNWAKCWRDQCLDPRAKTTVFKSLGIAVEDVAAGELVYRRAMATSA